MNHIQQPLKQDLLDAEVIDQIREMGIESGSNLLRDIIKIFTDEAPKQISSIRLHWERKDYASLAKTAHHFKSSCHGMGVPLMAKLCQQIEASSLAQQIAPQVIERLVDELGKTYTEVLPEIKKIAC